MKLKPIKPSDYPELKRFFKDQRYSLCAYSLSSIIAWSNSSYQPYGAIDGDAFIICAEFTTRKENRHMILPVSPVKAFSPGDLYDLALKLGFERYWFVPDAYMETFGRSKLENYFEVSEQPEYTDYIYQTEDLALLKGNKYSKKRNLIKQFQREYFDAGRVKVENITSAVASECIDFLEEWCEERDCDRNPEDDLACEKIAAINTIENIEALEVNGILLRLDNVISAFGIASHLTADMGVFHFEKAFSDIKGLYQFFDNLCAKRFFNRYKYINKESDMNIPGLARAKKSYHPVMMVKSYMLTLR